MRRGELTWTDEMFRIYETTPAEFVVSWESMLAQCTPESRERFTKRLARAESGDGQLDLELEITTLKNQRIWVRMIGHIEMLDGRPFRAFGSVQNIQAQKLAQIALENSTGWLKLSMNMAHMHAWRWDKAQDVLEFAIVDGRKCICPRFSRHEGAAGAGAPEGPGGRARAIENAFSHRSEVREEFRLQANDGSYRSYATIARPLFDAAGAPQRPRGRDPGCDRAARVGGAIAPLRAAAAHHHRQHRGHADPGRHGAAGSLHQQALTRLDDRADRRPRDFRRAAGGGARQWSSTKLRTCSRPARPRPTNSSTREDGAMQYFENRAVLVRDDGIGTGISISVRDITERKRLEQEILDVSSRERQSIGRDLHDGLGQELTGVALMLRGLATRIQQQLPRGGRRRQRNRRARQSIDRERRARSRADCCRCAPTPAACRSALRDARRAQPRSVRARSELSAPRCGPNSH